MSWKSYKKGGDLGTVASRIKQRGIGIFTRGIKIQLLVGSISSRLHCTD